MEKLENTLVIVTGCGYREAKRVFNNHKQAVILEIDGKAYKVNVGGATSIFLAKKGVNVLMVARTEEKLKVLKEYIEKKTQNIVSFFPCDLTDKSQIERLSKFVNKKYQGKRIWLIQSVGLGAQAYNIKNGNPYLLLEEIEPELVVKEYEVIVNSLLLMIKILLPRFRNQDESRVVVMNSMSGIRPYLRGYSHSASKGGLYNAVRSLTLELFYKCRNVYISQIMPGIVDTGLYDSESVINALSEVGESFGVFGDKKWKPENFPLINPESVAEVIWLCLVSETHIIEIDLVAKTQIPHKGA